MFIDDYMLLVHRISHSLFLEFSLVFVLFLFFLVEDFSFRCDDINAQKLTFVPKRVTSCRNYRSFTPLPRQAVLSTIKEDKFFTVPSFCLFIFIVVRGIVSNGSVHLKKFVPFLDQIFVCNIFSIK